jgi:hypothetical protein
VIYVPLPVFYGVVWMQELAFKLLKRQPVLTRYRLTSSQKHIVYDGTKIVSKLGWKPTVALASALEQLVASEVSKRDAYATTTARRDAPEMSRPVLSERPADPAP